MKRLLPFLVALAFAAYFAAPLLQRDHSATFDLDGFGRLPVLVNGRLKPMDTVARTSLLVLQNRQRVSSPLDKEPLVNQPIEWLLDVLFHGEKADTYPTFAIDNPEVLALLGFTEDQLRIDYPDTARRVLAIFDFVPKIHRRFSYQQISGKLPEIDKQSRLAEQTENTAELRTPFQRAIIALRDHLVLYNRLKQSLVPPGSTHPLRDYETFQNGIAAGAAAIRAREQGQPHDEAAARATLDAAQRYDFMARMGYLLAVPPASSNPNAEDWKPVGSALLETFRNGQLNPHVMAYAGLGEAWRAGNATSFNEIVRLYRETLKSRYAERLKKSDAETRFNAAEPFYRGISVFACAFFIGIASLVIWPEVMRRSAFYVVTLSWLVMTAGIITRMWLEGRPPVTNLYSSAPFIGWAAVGLCLVLELLFKNGVGSIAAGAVGFCTLLIAHHLSLSGDTLEMMRAVLDSNFWLATHVVVVTIGYAATFLAGFIALIYVVLGLTTRLLSPPLVKAFNSMVYGIVCFATLFSLVGTILGGIWADQSWGRFWGWDPKENGALIIVVWNALILHARWGGMIKTRGIMALAIFGNVVTSWSWFGTNMLGVGLHTYGFMDAAFFWLVAFVTTQMIMIGLANLPLRWWRSFAKTDEAA